MSSLFSKIAGIFGKSEPKEESSQHTAPEATTANDAVKAEPLTASDNIDDTDDVNIENSGDSENIDNLDITEPALLIRISRAYDTNMTEQELYDITRSSWKVNYDRVKNVEYAFSIYQGQILEVYKVAGWYGAGTTFAERNEDALASGRFEFVGTIAEDSVRDKYINKSAKHLFKPGNASPVMYLNC
ncbi:hypothetical protein [Psychrobacter piechaudii]|uniref:Uncharacterized protein n=1 Tax=Psychrobacter piechaudii TaxID=1945521 RepID=A0A1R4GX54_9GAMM|nr:hypothetical protein [Psychrobacter piechaudii]SJM72830.1 hypothetical protein A1232T_02029 [Psychrobacter piechaudii]